MSVENVKVKYIRPKHTNLREWMKDDENEYIGRAGVVFIDKERYPKVSSQWANPFKIGKHGNREEVLEKYEKYIRCKLQNDTALCESLIHMKGKKLGCWCAPEPCHGNILLRLIEEFSTNHY